ncbi:hypothetical protein EB796_006891 [Bugula neritina]|uniref:Uncharacterized protein n=1 Tax=Bugula neritina TaxID=10212 RepID=A0A7J7K995_BUGNE|nr:hypothetical protein EB796_006891 [Bugula neritina]
MSSTCLSFEQFIVLNASIQVYIITLLYCNLWVYVPCTLHTALSPIVIIQVHILKINLLLHTSHYIIINTFHTVTCRGLINSYCSTQLSCEQVHILSGHLLLLCGFSTGSGTVADARL